MESFTLSFALSSGLVFLVLEEPRSHTSKEGLSISGARYCLFFGAWRPIPQGGINWVDASLFQRAYSGINWTDAHYLCFDDNGVPSSDADGTCP